MFEHLSNLGSDNSFWGTSQGSQVAQQKLMTNGMTSGGAESLVKGSIPTNAVDKLKLANAYGNGGHAQGDIGKMLPEQAQEPWILPRGMKFKDTSDINSPTWLPGLYKNGRFQEWRRPKPAGQIERVSGGGVFSGVKALLGKLF